MRSHGKHRRVPTTTGRRAATASLASVAVLGAAFSAGPAFATTTPPVPAGTSPSGGLIGPLGGGPLIDPRSGVSNLPMLTPATTLAANHSSVTVGDTITFTTSEKAPDGTPVAGNAAEFFVHTVSGWKSVRTATTGADGTATFTFKPNYDHAYKVEFSADRLAAATGGAGTATAGTEIAAAETVAVTVTAKPKDIGAAIVAAAAREKGHPYVFGAEGPKYFDCSGLVKYVYHQFGIDLPHNADSMKHYGTRVSEKDAKPGDLVFVFTGSYAHHVAIYAGNGMWWEAPHTGASVRLVKIWSHNIEFRHLTK